ncbi:hypothetical protein [Novosphingobium soli]|uniref:Periplasmic heavy metal sensor n=1 Tax=Novosphingobium soli TaxID=574956 RepID=A0ABV6CXS4_9SPHN
MVDGTSSGAVREAKSFSAMIGRFTAAVVAITALIAALTSMTVAIKAGWKEVGPFFVQLLTTGKAEIPPRTEPKPDPVLMSGDLAARLKDDDSVDRHKARDDLAQAIATASPGSVSALVAQASPQDYRLQLGIAVALAKAPGGWRAADGTAQARLQEMAAGARDATLGRALRAALANQRR